MEAAAGGQVGPDDWDVLQAIAHHLYARPDGDGRDAALAATRLVGYLRTAAVDINVIAGVFGASGTGFWITIDFKDDLDLICFPLTLSSRDGGVEPKPRVSPQRSS